MKMSRRRGWTLLAIVVLGGVLVVLPQAFGSGYAINLMIDTVRWTIFALAFDLVAGHVSAVSLGQPVFYGFGAYVAALLAPRLGLGYVGGLLLAAVLMGVLALGAGVAFFRVRRVTFAIGTLGAAIIAQLIANSATRITGGALCTSGIARPEFTVPFTGVVLRVVKPIEFYYLLLPLLGVALLIYILLTTSRIGRAFVTVREDEVRASAVGVFPLRYRLLAFAVGSGLTGMLGAFQAHYVTVVCPTEMGLDITTTLLIIVFVGGAARLRGVLFGSLLFGLLPRVLELVGGQVITPAYQQMIYGVILVLVMVFMPDGLDGVATRALRRLRRRAPKAEVQA
jgi:branched-chain amino acid transport system permease protein